MTRLRGRARGGARCIDYAPNGHWMTTTLIGALRLDGTTACMTIDGATSGEVFHAYVKHVLAPTLQQGDIVILDNLSAHKNADAIRLIEEAGRIPVERDTLYNEVLRSDDHWQTGAPLRRALAQVGA